ncbi:unnamed protein product, partial [Musa acuminata subsp. burmannicoides]
MIQIVIIIKTRKNIIILFKNTVIKLFSFFPLRPLKFLPFLLCAGLSFFELAEDESVVISRY